eukprot:2584204-Rhodomonas_salina.2
MQDNNTIYVESVPEMRVPAFEFKVCVFPRSSCASTDKQVATHIPIALPVRSTRMLLPIRNRHHSDASSDSAYDPTSTPPRTSRARRVLPWTRTARACTSTSTSWSTSTTTSTCRWSKRACRAITCCAVNHSDTQTRSGHTETDRQCSNWSFACLLDGSSFCLNGRYSYFFVYSSCPTGRFSLPIDRYSSGPNHMWSCMQAGSARARDAALLPALRAPLQGRPRYPLSSLVRTNAVPAQCQSSTRA